MIKGTGIMLLIMYSCWLTGDKIERMGWERGVNDGYKQGMQQGFEVGRREACMVKPI